MASYDEVIPPGQVGHLIATLDTRTLKGPVVKGVSIWTNDPRRPQVLLGVRADVVGSVELLPQPVLFMRERDGEYVARALIRKEDSEEGLLEVGAVETAADWLEADVLRLNRPTPRGGGLPPGREGDWVLEVRFRDDVPVFGKRREKVSFSTGLTREPRVDALVVSELVAPVNLPQERLVLVPDEAGRASRTVMVSVRRGLEQDGLRVEAVPETLKVEAESSNGRIYQLTVRWDGSDPATGAIVLRVGAESMHWTVERTGR